MVVGVVMYNFFSQFLKAILWKKNISSTQSLKKQIHQTLTFKFKKKCN